MRKLYTFFISLYGFAIRIAALFNPKAALWIRGRRNWRNTLSNAVSGENWLWFHCASLGEFEQGRPIMERCKAAFPQWKIALTFFSPSGYEVRKAYNGADLVMYLPLDTGKNAKDFLELLSPSYAFFVKSEIWPNYFLELRNRNIPLYMISARFRPGQRFLQQGKGFWKTILAIPEIVFVQDEPSLALLQTAGYSNGILAGDTRYDRVLALASEFRSLHDVESFIGNRKAIVFGSCWPPEDEVAQLLLSDLDKSYCMVLVPHDVSNRHIDYLRKRFGSRAVLLSEWGSGTHAELLPVLIVDSIGLLGSIYRLATMAIVGGGFGTGLHNILEPAVYGLPVGFGAHHRRFPEAKALVEAGGAFDHLRPDGLFMRIREMLRDEPGLRSAGAKAKEFVQGRAGAVEVIWKSLKDNQVIDELQKHHPEI
jgi:3-deoxy-D-manno-octulosonic-acid transferase